MDCKLQSLVCTPIIQKIHFLVMEKQQHNTLTSAAKRGQSWFVHRMASLLRKMCTKVISIFYTHHPYCCFSSQLWLHLSCCFITKQSQLARKMRPGSLRVSHEAPVWPQWLIGDDEWSVALLCLKGKTQNTFHILSGAHSHARIHCAHTCVKLKLSQPYIWLRTLFLLIKHFCCRSISEDTFSCFDVLQVMRVIATRCIYKYWRWC